MTEILPNLHWIKGRVSNLYLWVGESGLVLIDTGLAGDVDKILSYISQIGRQPNDLQAILITHADIDHAGGAAAIQAHSSAPIFAAKETADLLIEGKSPKHLPWPIQQIMDRFIRYKPIPEKAIQHIAEGAPIPGLESWQVLATPGHTMAHHSFFNLTQGILIAGDALKSNGGNLKCTASLNTADMTAARKSARRLLRLTPIVVACGHGDPFLDFSADDIMKLDRQLA